MVGVPPPVSFPVAFAPLPAASEYGFENVKEHGLQNGPYEALGLVPAASAEEVKAAYFERAMSYHPDLHLPGDRASAAEFRRLSMAYWTLREPSRRARWDQYGELLKGFSLEDMLGEWFSLMLFGEDMETVIGDELFGGRVHQHQRDDHFLTAHFEVPIAKARSHQTGVSTVRRQKCKLCNRRMKGPELMMAHLVSAHGLDPDTWEKGVERRCLEGFSEFMQAAVGFDVPGPGSRLKGAFTHPDGSRGCFKDSSPPLPIHWDFEQAVDFALEACDPGSLDAITVATAQGAPQEMLDVLAELQKQQPESAIFFAPGEMANMDTKTLNPAHARYSSKLHRHHRSTRNSSDGSSASPERNSLRRSSRRDEEEPLNCSCGFTSGTAAALARHLDRFPDDPAHEAEM